MVPIYEVFLVLHPVSSRVAELASTLEPMIDGEPPLADLDLHYRAAADTALIALHFDERALGGDALRRLDETARGAGFLLVDPARLSHNERRTFFEARLPQFEPCARGLRSSAEVIAVLRQRMSAPQPAFARATPRNGTRRLVVTIPPLPPAVRADGTPPRPATLPPPPREDTKTLGRIHVVQRRARNTDRISGAHEAIPEPLGDTPSPVDLHAIQTARLTPPRRAPTPTPTPTDVVPPSLDVRFLRGGDWVPARARALSAKGAYIVTSAPARLGDTVHVSVSCASHTALVRGTVYHVTTADDAVSTGASGFAVRFPEYACPARTHLIQVLLAARHAGITLRPPPTRTAVRFPVRWPVLVTMAAGSFRAEAHDISAGGLFVATSQPIEVGTDVRFTLTLDLAEPPVEGRGRVSRSQEAEATTRGMFEGIGVQIVSMVETDRARWDAFLGRVRRRTEKKVLLGASPGRVEELAAGLAGAGYNVTSGSDLGLLMRVAELDPCPPDLAVIDAEFDRGTAPAGWIEQVFAARQVQCVTIQGDARRARSTVDRLLLAES